MNRAGLCRFLRENRVLLLLLAAGLAARLCLALPGLLTDPAERFSRPDSSGYLGPALALAESGRFLDAPGGEPSAVRAFCRYAEECAAEEMEQHDEALAAAAR